MACVKVWRPGIVFRSVGRTLLPLFSEPLKLEISTFLRSRLALPNLDLWLGGPTFFPLSASLSVVIYCAERQKTVPLLFLFLGDNRVSTEIEEGPLRRSIKILRKAIESDVRRNWIESHKFLELREFQERDAKILPPKKAANFSSWFSRYTVVDPRAPIISLANSPSWKNSFSLHLHSTKRNWIEWQKERGKK